MSQCRGVTLSRCRIVAVLASLVMIPNACLATKVEPIVGNHPRHGVWVADERLHNSHTVLLCVHTTLGTRVGGEILNATGGDSVSRALRRCASVRARLAGWNKDPKPHSRAPVVLISCTMSLL